MFQNISPLIAVTYFFALLSVGRAKYRCIWYWFIALPCSQCTNPPNTNTHTVWRVAGLRSQLSKYHTIQRKYPIVSQNIWWLQIYCSSHPINFQVFKVWFALNKIVFQINKLWKCQNCGLVCVYLASGRPLCDEIHGYWLTFLYILLYHYVSESRFPCLQCRQCPLTVSPKCLCYKYTSSKKNWIYNITFFKSILQQLHLHGSFDAAAVVVPFPNYAESTHVNRPLNNNENHGTKHDHCLNNISPNNSLEATLPEEEPLMMLTDNIRLQVRKSQDLLFKKSIWICSDPIQTL